MFRSTFVSSSDTVFDTSVLSGLDVRVLCPNSRFEGALG